MGKALTTAIRVIWFLIATSYAAAATPTDPPPGKLPIHFFGSSSCRQCREIIEEILQPIVAEHPKRVSLHVHYLEDRGVVRRMMRMEHQYGVRDRSPQELYFADVYLGGYDEITERARGLIEARLQHPERWASRARAPPRGEIRDEVRRRFQQFTLLGVIAAGLVDGVNPCAIATMIFLISFLAVQKRRRLEILLIGLSYTGAVFLTYLLLGLGAFTVLTKLGVYGVVSATLRWTAVAFAAGVGVLSFWDAAVFHRTGKTAEIRAQLPEPVKIRIHRIISGNLRRSQVFAGAVTAGFLVTLLEAVCTGQIYLPTILIMTRTSGLRLTGWLYLVLYNFLFVLPLLLIMVLAYYGLTWEKLAGITQRRLSVLKVLLGTVLIGLALFLAFS